MVFSYMVDVQCAVRDAMGLRCSFGSDYCMCVRIQFITPKLPKFRFLCANRQRDGMLKRHFGSYLQMMIDYAPVRLCRVWLGPFFPVVVVLDPVSGAVNPLIPAAIFLLRGLDAARPPGAFLLLDYPNA